MGHNFFGVEEAIRHFGVNPTRDQIVALSEITHPFHPLKGKRFPILKVRRVQGIETLILQGTSHGTLVVPREWTDRGDPPPVAVLGISPLPFLEGRCLLQLAELVSLIKQAKSDLDP